MNPSIAFLRANTYRSEPRLIKISGAVRDFRVSFVLWDRQGQGEQVEGARYFRRSLSFGDVRGLVLGMLPWSLFCFRQLCSLNPDIVHACDIECAVGAYLYARIFRKVFVYDLWDATSGKLGSGQGPLARIANALDRFYARRAKIFILPNAERIEQIGMAEVPANFLEVPNSVTIRPERLKVSLAGKKKILVSYVGVMSRHIRGLEQIMQASRQLESFQFMIAGYGPDEEALAKEFSRCPRVTFHGRVSHERALALNKEADLCITLLDPAYENYRYATSTKAYEAFSLMKPVITTQGTATGQLVREAAWGVAVAYDTGALVRVLSEIAEGKLTFDLDTKNVQRYSWDTVAESLRARYATCLA